MHSLQFPSEIDNTELAAEQKHEGKRSHVIPNLITLPFGDNTLVVCDRSTGAPRPVVPVSLRRKIFKNLHGRAHPGIQPSIRLVMERFAWNGLQKDVRGWTRCCILCQSSKVHRHNKAPVGTFSTPDAYRPRQSPFPITRSTLSSYLCRQIHTMARSHPIGRQPHRDRHPCLHAKLDCSVWRADISHDRSWFTV